ncbi:DUF998 domain-containing protein [Pedococcus sp. 2YAF34]|uniref:DUF998 domain-containing protein n=1 Tax=Pedococcus sp. 2YAF34 TaxID=3233032 RepID=UPI003F989C75
MRGRSRGREDGVPYAAWLGQPGYLAAEVLLALLAGVHYSLADDTISALGTGCDSPTSTGCSSAPWAMNLVFVVFGALQAVGAVPLLRQDAARARVVGWLWVVAGTFSVGVGLAPVDAHPTLHSLVALPVFVAQPLAVLLHARWLTTGRVRVSGTALGVAAVVGAVAFAVLLGADSWSGTAERLAIWPAKLWLPLAALTQLRSRRRTFGLP